MGISTAPVIAVLPGDGIGPEVVAAARSVLEAVRPDCSFVECAVGGAAIRKYGSPLPAETVNVCNSADAILFGAVGSPEFDALPLEQRPEAALLQLRKQYDLFANVRPARMLPGLESSSSLRSELVTGLDLVIVRELTSGIYYGARRDEYCDGVRTVADEMVYREPEIERIVHFAFDLARQRRKHLVSVDKANVLATSRLWREVVNSISRDYSDVTHEHMLVDTAAMRLLQDPCQFDVLVTENMFGDILSDEAAMLTGSIGNLPSASLGSKTTAYGRFGLCEPIAGSAPDIAGRGIANPVGAIFSVAMLARFCLTDEYAGRAIERAVDEVMAAGVRTPDVSETRHPVDTARFVQALLLGLKRQSDTPNTSSPECSEIHFAV